MGNQFSCCCLFRAGKPSRYVTSQLGQLSLLPLMGHKGPLFRMFPLSLQSIISNQMWPRRLRGAWFGRLLRHPARRWSGSILSPGTHSGLPATCTNETNNHCQVCHTIAAYIAVVLFAATGMTQVHCVKSVLTRDLKN